jgi:hypothetical protein
MKHPTSISALLGLTHEQMAILLSIGMTHYSMFESGKRDLPLHAEQFLGEILTHMQPATTAKKVSATDPKELREHLDRMVNENQFQRLRLEREIAALERKHEKAERMERLSEFLNSRGADGKSDGTSRVPAPQLIGAPPKGTLNSHATALMKLRLRQEVLENETAFLQLKLEKLPIAVK